MKIKSLIILLLFSYPLFAQLTEDFSDGNITNNPVWNGDIGNFLVNAQGELQLNATGAGASLIYTAVDFPDSNQMDFYFRMELSPSDNNNTTIYLSIDNPDPSLASGYYIRIGENGSSDAIKLFYLNNGVSELIATGTLGALTNSPAEARVRIVKLPDSMWEISVDYDGGTLLTTEIVLSEDRYVFGESQYFALHCNYTSSNITKYHFDDIFISKYKPDSEPPFIVNAEVINAQQLVVKFNEAVSETTAEDLNNYMVDKNIGMPISASHSPAMPNQVLLGLGNALVSGELYTLTVKGVEDVAGNELQGMVTTQVFLTVSPEVGDLLISEVLFDPYSGGEDFVEIYNYSQKFIALEGLVLRNEQKSEEDILHTDMVMLPGEYVAITPDKPFLEDNYIVKFPDRIISNAIPSMNNDEGNITIKNAMGDILDSFDYNEDMHYVLLDDTEGVSLERLSFESDTNGEGNWFSAASTAGYATPGYVNSNFLAPGIGTEAFAFEHKVFSPNGDGDKDQLLIIYKLEKPGYLANFKVFDIDGFEIVSISNNQLLSTNGLLRWDGTDMEGYKSKIGMYIVYGEAVHPDGDVETFKQVCVLADIIE